MNYIDIALIVILAYAAFKGWKTGGISSLINLVGTLVVIIASYYIKNPLSVLLYTKLPFFSFGGLFTGITSLNIIIYETISYLICCAVLGGILAIIVKVTGIVDKVVNKTLIISLPSKILGVIASVIQHFIFCFIIIFVLAQIPYTANSVQESVSGVSILEHTPALSAITNDLYSTGKEVYEIAVKTDGDADKTQANYDALEVLLKYQVISTDNAKKLLDSNKLDIPNSEELLNKYKNQ